MSISPINSLRPGNISGPTKGQKTSRSAFNSHKKIDRSSVRSSSKTSVVSSAEIKELAFKLQQGDIDKQEASRKFVALVVNNSLYQSLGEGDRQKMIDDINNFFADDKDFSGQLINSLQDLAT